MKLRGSKDGGFTLLEVMIAIGILSMSLTSLLTSQMASMRATRYAQGVTAAAFLAESKLIDIEYRAKIDGWVNNDQEYDGTFDEEGWPDIRYECLADFIELPEYSELQAAVDAAENDTDGRTGVDTQDVGEQAFGMLGMVWPVIKGAIENSIRKAECTVFWQDGKIEHDFTVNTFWVDTERLKMLPELGGEASDADDTSSDAPGSGGGSTPGGGGRPAGGRGQGQSSALPGGGAGIGGGG